MALHNSGSSSRDIGFDPPRSPGVRGKALHRLSSFPKLLGETSRALASPTRDGPLSPSMSPEPRSPGGRPVPPPKPSSSSKPAFARKSKSSSISLLSGRGQADRSQRIDAAENVGPPPMSAEQLAKTADTSYVRGWLDQSGNWVDSGDGVAQLEAAGVQIISRPSPPILPPRLPNASEPDFLKKYDRPPSANGSTGSTFLSTSSQRAAILSSWNATSSSQELHAPSRSHLARGRSSETVNSSGFSRPSTSPSIQSNSYESSLSGYPLMKDRDRASPSPNLTPRPAMSASPFLNPHTAGPAKGSVPSPGNSLGMASGGPFGLNTYLASANVSPRASTKPLFDPATGSARPTTSPGARARSNTSQHAGLLGAHLQSSPDTSTRLQPPPPPRHKAAVASGGRTHPFDSPVPPPPGGVAGALGQIGGIGAAVGKRGWEFMRGFNGPSSPNRPNAMENNSNWSFATVGRAGSPATVYSGAPAGANSVNEATRRWNAASSGPSTAGRVGGNGMLSVGWAAGAQEDAPAGVFGMPLREAVLRTRLVRQSQRRVEAEEKTLRARISDLDLGSEFHLPSSVLGGSSPSSSPTASPRSPPYRSIGPDKKAAGRSRAPIPRDKARTVYLPGVAVRCIESLEKYGFTEEGIYRLSGRSSHTAKLRAIFDAPAPPAPSLDVAPDLQLSDIEPADLDINAVCSLFKSYLRDLPSPLLSRELAPAFDAACRAATGTPATGAAAGIGLRPSAAPAASAQELTAMSGASAPAGSSGAGATRGETQLASEIAPLISRLPAPNFYLLRELADHLGDLATDEVVAHTKMPLLNLCLVLAPTLFLSVAMLKVLVSHRAALFAIAPEPDAELDAVLHTADQTPLASTSALPSPPKLPSRRPKPLQMLQTPIQGRHSLDVGPRTAPVIPPRPNTSKAAVIAQFDGPAASIVNLGIPATSRSSSNTFGPARVSKPTGSARGGASVTPMSSGLPALSVSSDGGDGYSNGYANSIGNGNGSGTENIEEDGPPIARYFVRKRTGSLSAADSLLSISSLSTSTDGGSLSTPRPGGGSGRPSFSSSEKSGRSTVLGTSSEMEGRMGGLVDRPRPQTSGNSRFFAAGKGDGLPSSAFGSASGSVGAGSSVLTHPRRRGAKMSTGSGSGSGSGSGDATPPLAESVERDSARREVYGIVGQ